jgi:ribonuclease BN (tRNA processing enzyme)
MLLQILGCGPILQTKEFKNCSGYLIDNRILFDCGPGIWGALNRNHINAAQLHHIVLSHFHIDHVSDMAPFLMARYLMLDKTDQQLTLSGPAGLRKWFNKLAEFCGDWVPRIPVTLNEVHDIQALDEYQLISELTGHSDSSMCYRLEDNTGATFFYSGDSDESRALETTARDCDLAIFESSNTEKTKVEGHLTPGRAAKIATHANVKKLVLTHMYPEVSEEYAHSQASKYFSGEIFIARDGMIINTHAD